MKTLEQLKELASKCLDGRDFNRLAKFIPYNMIKDFGMEPNEEYNNEERWNSTVVEFTRENVLKQLEEDVRFGFEKALNQRGISASLMFECVMMWNYILKMSEVKEYKPVTAEDMNPYILFKTSKFGNIKVRFPKDEDMNAELLVLDQLFDVE